MEFLNATDTQQRDLKLQEIAKRVDLHGLVELRNVESDKFDLYPENQKQEIYDHNVRIFQSYVANVLLQDLALPDQLREYLYYTVEYCEKYLDGTLTAEDQKEEDLFAAYFA
jgi:uncharacterized membrane protein YebE (DUF533 family)